MVLKSQIQSHDEGLVMSTIRRWPALSICLSVTVVLYLLLFCLAAAGWPGSEATSNCYEDYLVTPDCFCEKLYGDKPGDVWIAQPMNTLTNIWFNLVGLLIAYAADSRQFPSKEWWFPKNNNKRNTENLILKDKMYSIVLALDASLLGVGSTFLHASFTQWGREADMSAMYLIATFMIVYPLVRDKHFTRDQAIWTYCLGNASLIYWVTHLSTPEQARKLFTTLIIASWVIEIFFVDPEWAKKNSEARKIYFANLVMFVSAVLQWKASESGGPLCAPESIWQGHSLWHFQSALGILGVFLYYLREDEPSAYITSSDEMEVLYKNERQQQPQVVVEMPPPGTNGLDQGVVVFCAESVTSHSSSFDPSSEGDNSDTWSEPETSAPCDVATE